MVNQQRYPVDGEREAQYETQHADEPDLYLPDGERGVKGRLLVRGRRSGPGIHHRLEGDPVHCLERRGHRQAGNRSASPEAGPSRAAPRLQLVSQAEERGNQQRDAPELRQVAGDPETVCGVFGEGREGVARVGLPRMQICPDEEQDAPGDCARRSHSASAATRHPLA